MTAAELLSRLNPEQRRAVEFGDGPLLIIAGAGSGKTRVLTYRIAHLIHVRGVPPWRILAVTFTNKAAREMKERIEQLIGTTASGLWIGTFHSICGQILRREASVLGYTSHFLIFDTTDQLGVVKEVMKELNLDAQRFEPRTVLSQISRAKNELIGPETFSDRAADFVEKQIARVYKGYQQRLKNANAMDFDDLLLNTVLLFRNHPDVLANYQNRFDYILVDEYQDTNHAQYVLVNRLAERHRNICVVGDEDQSIYSFRGADIRNILDFEKDYPDATVIKLEQNYRCTQVILEAANQVIAHNVSRKSKRLWTGNPRGNLIRFFQAGDEGQEASFVAAEIQRRSREDGLAYQDFTILYRTHAQSRTFEEEFIRWAIPYRIVAGLRFYERKEVKDILAYLRVLANPADDFSLRRIANVPRRGLGSASLDKLEAWASARGLAIHDALRSLAEAGGSGDVPEVSGRAAKAAVQLYQLLERLRAELVAAPQGELADWTARVMRESGYLAELEAEKTEEAAGRLENLNEFLNMVKQFEAANPGAGIDELLEHVALVSDVDAYDPDANAVTMMTFHSAKGLEFPVVFMVGMEEGIFPHARSLWGGSKDDIEEERRLCYVGITRAQKDLYFTCARQRTQYGASTPRLPSPFLREVGEDLIEEVRWAAGSSGIGYGAAPLWPSASRSAVERTAAPATSVTPAMSAARPAVSSPVVRGSAAGGPVSGDGGPGGDAGAGPASAAAAGAAAARAAGAAGGTTGSGLQPGDVKAGDRVRHARFGVGTIVAIQSAGDDAFVTVSFDGQGLRKFLLSMAQFTRA